VDTDLTRVKDPDSLDPVKRAIWDQHGPVGLIMSCAAASAGAASAKTSYFWSPAGAAQPDPKVLAQQAVATMSLEAPEMGVWPGGWYDHNPKAWGAVRIPVWFWAQNAKPGVSGVATASASADGRTVVAQARLVSITWTDDAGHRVVCGTGSAPLYNETAWESPSGCGWTYDKEGDYTVTAVTQIRVDWTGLGRTGVIDLTFTQPSHTLRIGEIQVVVTSGTLN
jgi:hypothetical protein